MNNKFPTTTHFSTIYEMHPLKSIYAGSRISPLGEILEPGGLVEFDIIYDSIMFLTLELP